MKYLSVLIISISSILINVGCGDQKMNIMSYNIRYDNPNDGVNKWDNRKESLLTLIHKYDPNIFGIQEGLLHQVEFLDKKLAKYNYIGIGRDDGEKSGEFSAIFFDTTKFSVLDQSTFWLSENPDTVSKGWDAALERICTYGLLNIKGSSQDFWVFNTHFDHMGVEAREKSSELITKKINELNIKQLPTILMGDLNSTPDSKAIQILNKNLHDAFSFSKKEHVGPIGTFTGFKQNASLKKRIDYIFLKDFKVLSFEHIDEKRIDGNFISDHLPVFANIQF